MKNKEKEEGVFIKEFPGLAGPIRRGLAELPPLLESGATVREILKGYGQGRDDLVVEGRLIYLNGVRVRDLDSMTVQNGDDIQIWWQQ